ncbi:MAG: hypothetical protein Q4C60_07815 [Eubacteriales bacterium]|nr:hypothetical protein [Eubacteriales bacterium]
MKKTIEIDGKPVQFKASAAIPRIYRIRFRRDIFGDLGQMSREMEKSKKGDGNIDISSLEMFENIAYLMAKHADPEIPDSVEEWLDQFETFSIYQVLPEIVELWHLNVETQVEAKKNLSKAAGN